MRFIVASSVANKLLALNDVFNDAVITGIGEPEGVASDFDTLRRGKFIWPFFSLAGAHDEAKFAIGPDEFDLVTILVSSDQGAILKQVHITHTIEAVGFTA